MKVAELDLEARELIAAGREGELPSPLVRARVQRSVQNKLAAGLGVAAMTYAPSVLGAAAKAGALLAVVAAVATGGYYYASTGTTQQVNPPEPPRTVGARAPVPHKIVPAPVERRPVERNEAESDAPKSNGAKPPSKAKEGAKPSAEVGLKDEIALLSKASAALNRGQTARARELLEQYDKLGSRHLIEERSATGVLVLCRSGQVARARVAARRFFKRFPRSPLAARVQASCAGDSSRQ